MLAKNKGGNAGYKKMIPQTEIHLCSRDEIPQFTAIMCQAFNDKYPHFFKGLSEQDYLEVVTTLNLMSYDRFGNNAKYLMYDQNEPVGALEAYTSARKELPFGNLLKALMTKYRLIPALKTSLMLLGFGPPRMFPRKTFFIDKIGIREGFRRKGYGKKLMQFAFNLAREKGLPTIELEVIATNDAAIALYKKLGFRIISTTKTTLGRIFVGVEQYHRMRRSLG